MKKISIVALMAALALGMAGCKIELGDRINGNQKAPVEDTVE